MATTTTSDGQSAKPKPPFDFVADPSLRPFSVSAEAYLHLNNLASLPSSDTKPYALIATAALVFHPSPTQQLSSTTSMFSSKSSQQDELRVLLLQRSPTDSMPLCWEPPGGAVDPEDPSILHACARELFEEAGLIAQEFLHVVRPEGRVFVTRSGWAVGKFEFVVSVEGQEEGGRVDDDLEYHEHDGPQALPTVKLDPDEHCDFVWATEQECVNGLVREEGRVVHIELTTEDQKKDVLAGFQLAKEMTAHRC